MKFLNTANKINLYSSEDIFEDNKINTQSNKEDRYYTDINRIPSFDTITIVKEFLEEIKDACHLNTLLWQDIKKSYLLRFNYYQDNYDRFLNRVSNDDKPIFEKLINYLTAQTGTTNEDSDTNTQSYLCNHDYFINPESNLPLYIQYDIKTSTKGIKGILRNDRSLSIDKLACELRTIVESNFSDYKDNISYKELKMNNSTNKPDISIKIGYDFSLELEDKEGCLNKIQEIINSSHYKNWRFRGKRTNLEIQTLNTLYAAKNEVMAHSDNGSKVNDIIDVDINTCRYAASLVKLTKIGYFSRFKTIEEKNKLYNHLFPFFLEEIKPKDRCFFSKLVNYLTFENINYSISGYNNFSNTSRKAVEMRIDKFIKIINESSKIIPKHYVNTSNIAIAWDDITTNIDNFSAHFTGGSGISHRDDFKKRSSEILFEILLDDKFINWPFSGLKTPAEDKYELNYEDPFNEIGFSEESYFILGYLVHLIYSQEYPSSRQALKLKLRELLIQYIPYNERDIFNKLLDFFTKENSFGFDVNPHYFGFNILLYEKDSGAYRSNFILKEINQFHDFDESLFISKINNAVKPFINKYSHFTPVTSNDLYDRYYWTYKPFTSLLPNNLFNPNYSLTDFLEIRNILYDLNKLSS